MCSSVVSSPDVDLAVVGAGFAGASVAIKAAQMGLSVRVFDARPEYPGRFRADKLEENQHAVLEQLALDELVRPMPSPFVEEVTVFQGPKARVVPSGRQRGMDYQDTVNSFRAFLNTLAPIEVTNVTAVRDSASGCEVTLEDGTSVTARLGVMATGGSPMVRKSLGLPGQESGAMLSTSFGFFAEPADGGSFTTDAFNAFPARPVDGLQYITFFPMGGRIRANLFTCWDPASDNAKAFRTDPIGGLDRYFPHLSGQVGRIALVGKLQVATTYYYRQPHEHMQSTVLIGDEYQSVSPATGMGISKCATDARLLVDMLPALKEASGRIDLAAFYTHPDKIAVDEDARLSWEWANEAVTSRSLKTRYKKFKIAVKEAVGEERLARLGLVRAESA